MEFEGIWLEVKTSSADMSKGASIGSKVLEVPALSEVLEVASNTNVKHRSGLWNYSRRITGDEADRIKQVVNFIDKIEDEKSLSLLADVAFNGSCYTITLFAIKKSHDFAKSLVDAVNDNDDGDDNHT